MAFYIAFSRTFDFASIDAAAARGERPRHAIRQLADLLAATTLFPGDHRVSPLDRLRSKLVGRPEHWALARALRRQLTAGDVIFCPDEAIGIPVAALCGGQRKGPGVLVMVHNVTRPRARAALALWRIGRRADRIVAVSRAQTEFLRRELGMPADRALTLCDQTDVAFFTPAPRVDAARPVIMSIGLEKRDYRTLADATRDLDVDVRISGFSTDAVATQKAFPDVLPDNMTRSFYDWPDLLALYRSASVVAVSLYPNRYAAGIQGLLEATACGRPVVVTRTEGLAEYLDRPDLVTSVAPGDAAAMRAAIEAKLANPEAAEAQAMTARHHYLPMIDSELYVRRIADHMHAVARERQGA